jgi:Zn-dependent membrane protease YugP
MWFDPVWLLFALPGTLLAAWAQWRVTSTFRAWSEVGTRRGWTGADIARAILRVNGITDVRVEPTHGFLADHYDPLSRTLRLSPDVYAGRSVAATGVAAHEVGHAIQHARAFAPLMLRSALVPAVSVTSHAAPWALMLGLLLGAGAGLGHVLVLAGVGMFALMVLFQLVTLPVELDASRRALRAIEEHGLVVGDELAGARAVLGAAALTYLAAAVSSILQLLYWVSVLNRGRREE